MTDIYKARAQDLYDELTQDAFTEEEFVEKVSAMLRSSDQKLARALGEMEKRYAPETVRGKVLVDLKGLL